MKQSLQLRNTLLDDETYKHYYGKRRGVPAELRSSFKTLKCLKCTLKVQANMYVKLKCSLQEDPIKHMYILNYQVNGIKRSMQSMSLGNLLAYTDTHEGLEELVMNCLLK